MYKKVLYGKPYENIVLILNRIKPAQWVDEIFYTRKNYDYKNTFNYKKLISFRYWKKGTLKTVTYRDLNRKVNIFLMENRSDITYSDFQIECNKDNNEIFNQWNIKLCKKIETEAISTASINEEFITKRVIPYAFCTTKKEMMDTINKYISDESIRDKFNNVEWLPGMYFEMYLDYSYAGFISFSDYLEWKESQKGDSDIL